MLNFYTDCTLYTYAVVIVYMQAIAYTDALQHLRYNLSN